MNEWNFSFLAVWILFGLTFPEGLPEIPLIAYHLIQKEKLYLPNYEITISCCFLDLYLKYSKQLNRNFEKTIYLLMQIIFDEKRRYSDRILRTLKSLKPSFLLQCQYYEVSNPLTIMNWNFFLRFYFFIKKFSYFRN